VIAAGVVALSTAGAPAAVAADPDQSSEGTAVPEQTGGSDPALSPDFDPGGESTDLPFDAPVLPQVPAPPEPGDDDATALELEPTTDVDALVADPADDGAAPDAEQPLAGDAPPQSTAPASPNEEPAPAAPTPEAPVAASEPPGDQAEEHEPRTGPRGGGDEAYIESPSHDPQQASPSSSAPTATVDAGPPAATAELVQTAQAPSPVIDGAASGAAEPGDRFHVVRPGESLWSIAADVLGDGATVARVAREVNRLWELNAARIGTGDRDLLMVGTRLSLR
jgi:resuscitation-promoting factor RpfA